MLSNAFTFQTSFGFGQVGGTALVLHPRHLLGALRPQELESYRLRNKSRALQTYEAMSDMMISNSLVKIKEHPPYSADLEAAVLLNPLARTQLDKSGSYSFPAKLASLPQRSTKNAEVLSTLLAVESAVGVGVDQGTVSFR